MGNHIVWEFWTGTDLLAKLQSGLVYSLNNWAALNSIEQETAPFSVV